MRFEPDGATFFYVAEPQSIFGALRPLIKRCLLLRRCPLYLYDARIYRLCSTADFADIRIRKITSAGRDFHVCLRP